MRIGLRDAAELAQVQVGTIHQWVHKGVVTRYPDGFERDEIIAYRDGRKVANVRGPAPARGRRSRCDECGEIRHVKGRICGPCRRHLGAASRRFATPR